jgi:hypothetical protein
MYKNSKFYVLALFIFSFVFQQIAYSQAVLAPVENYVINRAIGGIIANRMMVARGTAANDAVWLTAAANDPVFKATMAGVSGTMTAANVASTALGVGLLIAGAPVWLTVAASLGVIAVGTYIALDGVNGTSLMIADDTGMGNRILVKNKEPVFPNYPGTGAATGHTFGIDLARSHGAAVYREPNFCLTGMACYDFPAMPEGLSFAFWKGNYVVAAPTISDLGKYYIDAMQTGNLVPGVTFIRESAGSDFTYSDTGNVIWFVIFHEVVTFSDPALAHRNTDTYRTLYPENGAFSSGSYSKHYLDLNTALPEIKPETLHAPMDATLLADLVNKGWQMAAAKPGYAGEPYPVSNPVTATDVMTWKNANLSTYPVLDDLLRRPQNPAIDTNGVPISPNVSAGSTSNPNTGNPASGNVNVINTPNVNVLSMPQVNLGADPATPLPTLENTPTGAEILSPLTGLFPELRSFQSPAHSGVCPKPIFDIFGKSILMDSHCTIAEQNRSAIGAVMLVAWLLVALRILLSA